MCGKEFVFLVLAAPPKPFLVSNLLNKLQSIDPNEPVKSPISRDADSAERKVHWKWKWNVVSHIFLLCHKSKRHEIITSTMLFYTSPCTLGNPIPSLPSTAPHPSQIVIFKLSFNSCQKVYLSNQTVEFTNTQFNLILF